MVKYELRKRTTEKGIVDLPEGAIVIESTRIIGNEISYVIAYLEKAKKP